MAWTAPMTAVSNTVFTASQFNVHVRDNLLETAPAKATAEGSYFVGNGTNSIVQRFPQYNAVDNSQTTTSGAFTNLSTTGPSISVVTGSRALIIFGANMSTNTAGGFAISAVEVTGATSIVPVDVRSLAFGQSASGGTGQTVQCAWSEMHTSLNPGTNVFTMKYRTTAGTSTFSRRHMTVIPF